MVEQVPAARRLRDVGREWRDEEGPMTGVLAEGPDGPALHVGATLDRPRHPRPHRAELGPLGSADVPDGLGMAAKLYDNARHDLMCVGADAPVLSLVQPSARQAVLGPVAVVATGHVG